MTILAAITLDVPFPDSVNDYPAIATLIDDVISQVFDNPPSGAAWDDGRLLDWTLPTYEAAERALCIAGLIARQHNVGFYSRILDGADDIDFDQHFAE